MTFMQWWNEKGFHIYDEHGAITAAAAAWAFKAAEASAVIGPSKEARSLGKWCSECINLWADPLPGETDVCILCTNKQYWKQK
jgi:hypothetical protein